MSDLKVRGFEVAKRFEEIKTEDGVKTITKNWAVTNMPKRATAHSAGYDFEAAESVVIPSIWQAVFRRMFITHEDVTETVDDAEVIKTRHKAHVKKIFTAVNKLDAEKLKEEVRQSFEPTLVHTGIKAYMKDDEVLELYNRSSNPKKIGLIVANGVGVVDSDYYGNENNDGEIGFLFYNLLPWVVKIKRGDKLGQGIFKSFLKADDDMATGQRVGGFGSSDGEQK